MQADVVAGDMNQHATGCGKEGVYHYKRITMKEKIEIPRKISDHPALIMSCFFTAKRDESEYIIRVCDKCILTNLLVEGPSTNLGEPVRIKCWINDKFQNVDWINECEEMMNKQKITSSGENTAEAWVKVNNALQPSKRARLWKPGVNDAEILRGFKELYKHGAVKEWPEESRLGK